VRIKKNKMIKTPCFAVLPQSILILKKETYIYCKIGTTLLISLAVTLSIYLEKPKAEAGKLSRFTIIYIIELKLN
jgi:hypothetical protein